MSVGFVLCVFCIVKTHMCTQTSTPLHTFKNAPHSKPTPPHPSIHTHLLIYPYTHLYTPTPTHLPTHPHSYPPLHPHSRGTRVSSSLTLTLDGQDATKAEIKLTQATIDALIGGGELMGRTVFLGQNDITFLLEVCGCSAFVYLYHDHEHTTYNTHTHMNSYTHTLHAH